MKWFGAKANGLLLIVSLTLVILFGTGGDAMGKYLTVDEQSTYIDVHCDGYVVNIHQLSAVQNGLFRFFNPDKSVQLYNIHGRIRSSSTTYYNYNDMSRQIILEINTSSYVRVRVISSSSLPTNMTSWTWILHIYPNTIIIDSIIDCSGSVTIDNTVYYYGSVTVSSVGGTLTNELMGYGTATETTAVASSAALDAAGENYLVKKSDEMVISGVDVYHTTGTGTWEQIIRNGYIYWFWNNGTLGAGKHRQVVAFNIDSADRENDGGTFNTWVTSTAYVVGDIVTDSGLRYYCLVDHTSGTLATDVSNGYMIEYRIALGDQYKDLVMDSPTTGSEVTDLVIPMDLASDGFASDGGRHFEMATDEVKYTNDITRIGQVDVIEAPPIETGTVGSSTDHLIEHIKADDNAASSTVVATVGDNANWETSEGVNRNTSNDTVSTDIKRGTGLDTVGTYHIEHVVTAYDNAYFLAGTKIIKFTPQFNYDVAADQTIWSLYVDAGDYIQITYDAGNDMYELRVSWGGTLTTIQSSAFTDNTSLQQLTSIKACWDAGEDLLQLSINGQVVANGTNTGTPSTSNATYVMTGADCVTDADGTGQLEADIYIDESTAIDGMLVMGGPFTGNGSVNTAHAHSDILVFVKGDESNGDTLQIPGSGTITVSGLTHVTGVDGVASSAFHSNGTGNGTDYAEFSSNGLIDPVRGRIGIWYKHNDTSSSTYASLLSHSGGGFHIRLSGTTAIYQYGPDGSYSSLYNLITTINYQDGLWHYWEYVYDTDVVGGTDYIELWIDGILQERNEVAMSAASVSTGTFILGNNAGKNRDCGGDIWGFTATSDPRTPQMPVILGSGPIHAPIQGIE